MGSPMSPYSQMTKSMFCYVKPPNWFGSKSKIEGGQQEYVIKILYKFHQITFSGVGGVKDKGWLPLCVREGSIGGRMEIKDSYSEHCRYPHF